MPHYIMENQCIQGKLYVVDHCDAYPECTKSCRIDGKRYTQEECFVGEPYNICIIAGRDGFLRVEKSTEPRNKFRICKKEDSIEVEMKDITLDLEYVLECMEVVEKINSIENLKNKLSEEKINFANFKDYLIKKTPFKVSQKEIDDANRIQTDKLILHMLDACKKMCDEGKYKESLDFITTEKDKHRFYTFDLNKQINDQIMNCYMLLKDKANFIKTLKYSYPGKDYIELYSNINLEPFKNDIDVRELFHDELSSTTLEKYNEKHNTNHTNDEWDNCIKYIDEYKNIIRTKNVEIFNEAKIAHEKILELYAKKDYQGGNLMFSDYEKKFKMLKRPVSEAYKIYHTYALLQDLHNEIYYQNELMQKKKEGKCDEIESMTLSYLCNRDRVFGKINIYLQKICKKDKYAWISLIFDPVVRESKYLENDKVIELLHMHYNGCPVVSLEEYNSKTTGEMLTSDEWAIVSDYIKKNKLYLEVLEYDDRHYYY